MQKKLFVLGFMILISSAVACAMEYDIDNGNFAKKIALWRTQAAQERKQKQAERYSFGGYSGFSDLLTLSKFGEITTMGEAQWRDDKSSGFTVIMDDSDVLGKTEVLEQEKQTGL